MDIPALIARQRSYFDSGATLPLKARLQALGTLAAGLEKHEPELLAALKEDLGKSPLEAYTSEIRGVLDEIAFARRRLKSWLRPRRAKVPFLALPGRVRVTREPCGTALIVGPWNYPLYLLLTPMVNALAAGCTVILKPSETTPRVSAAVAKLIAESFPDGLASVVEGDQAIAEELLTHPFGHLLFTGSAATGRKIMAAAARTLTPVTLELGGKCPVLVFSGDRDFSATELETAARRIAWGKHLNAGQTCVAPDHVLVEGKLHGPLIEALGKAFESFAAGDYGRMVNRAHFDRVCGFLGQGKIEYGGQADPERLTILPTILTGIAPGSPAMTEEIFGPVLPVIACENLDAALAQIRALPCPLAIYGFSSDPKVKERIMNETRSGGICFNDVVLQITGPDLPFGGQGESGMGRYRGKAGFDTFTRERAALDRALWPDLPFRYPPAKLSLGRFKSMASFLERFL